MGKVEFSLDEIIQQRREEEKMMMKKKKMMMKKKPRMLAKPRWEDLPDIRVTLAPNGIRRKVGLAGAMLAPQPPVDQATIPVIDLDYNVDFCQ